ncbi:hypothetical protein I4U23_016933 [Adineta vaga]|nr:hypothetical protein I4U23_016933 [Adineta vaga]
MPYPPTAKLVIGIISVIAIATGLSIHFKGKSDSSVISSNETTTTTTIIQESSSLGGVSTNQNTTTTVYNSSSTTVSNSLASTTSLTNVPTSSTRITNGVANSTTVTSIATATNNNTSTSQTRTNNLTVTRILSSISIIDQAYCRKDTCWPSLYYFEAYEMIVNITDYYTIKTDGTLDTYGYLYNNTFNPFIRSLNLIQEDDNNGTNNQFMLNMIFQSSIKYIIVVTTFTADTVAPYMLIITGPTSVQLTQIIGAGLQSQQIIYSSSLTRNSLSYCQFRNCSLNTIYYYMSFRINVSMNSTYLISSNSDIDTVGYIYKNSFNSSNPYENLLTYDDESAGYHQFALYLMINPLSNYILVLTTYAHNQTDSYSLLVDKADSINLTPI